MIRNYLKNFEKYSILISSLLVILGIFLLVSPMKSLEVAVIFFAAIMIVNGIVVLSLTLCYLMKKDYLVLIW